MSLANKIAKAGATGLIGAVFGLYSGKADAQALNIYTSLPTDLVRGETYQVDVRLDSTEFPNAKIGAADWKVFVPGYFTLVEPIAQLPSSNDFFEGYTMDFNMVDNTPIAKNGGYQLEANGRSTWGVHAPSNRTGDLENIFVRVNDDAPVGYKDLINVPNAGLTSSNNFGLYGVNIGDTDGGLYKYSSGNLTVFNPGFYIHAFNGDTDDDGDVDLTDLGILAGNYGALSDATWNMGNFDNDGDVDLTDLGLLAGNYENGVAQAMIDFERIRDVPEPSAVYVLPLIALGAGVIGGLERRVRRK